MSREWKPGDVAAVTITERNGGEATEYIAFYSGRYGWYGATDGKGVGGITDKEEYFEIERRPLVVIDPEDREQVRSVLEAFGRQFTDWTPELDSNVTRLQAALRSFVEPPNPPEPTGLGAVVLTANDEMYVRDKTTTTVAHWKRARGQENGKRHRYGDLRVVAVLSHGVEEMPEWERDLLRGAR